VDLFEQKDLGLVVRTLLALRRLTSDEAAAGAPPAAPPPAAAAPPPPPTPAEASGIAERTRAASGA